MKITINRDYPGLKSFVERLPAVFDQQGTTIYVGRNLIKVFQENGLILNVKRYRRPHLFNRMVYSWFRKPKATKAYDNAWEVLNRGFSTPVPIAYLLDSKWGLIDFSFFVSLHIEAGQEIRNIWFSKGEGEDLLLLRSFAAFTAQLHGAEIFHLDYSPGNILYEKHGEEYQFTLLDINRMQFRKVDLEQGCENFSRLFEYDEAIEIIAAEYAKLRGLDIAFCTERMLYHKRKFLIKDKKRDLRKAKKAS